MSRFLTDRYKGLTPYVPGEQPADMTYIKLNTNESPYPPSPKVLEALDKTAVDRLNLYPDPTGARLREKAAALYGLKPDNVFLANGSDEALAFAFMAFCDDRRQAVFPDITYGFYPVYCALFNIPCIQIPLREDFTLRSEDYFGINKNIIIPNPNAPTGLALPLGDIEQMLQTNPGHVVLVDEAYVDFGGRSAVGLVGRYENLLVVHTFSKSRSMAGARLGFVFGNAALIRDIDMMRYSFNSYNVNRLTLLAGEAALSDAAYYKDMQQKIVAARDKAASGLKALGFAMTDSKANFLFVRHPDIAGGALYKALREKGILVRHFDKPRISDYLRITVGTPEQMDTLIAALRTILENRNNLRTP
ncbi:histidinol-phosphate aminotransferase [Sporobacter termitidis DSM 10068]|uniref:Histidinol-phosphate aminotransferase n=1 Tax=Sporobacter termitidis DSM 10068 TaxID=1123282 RepID=A0A1M5VQW8_9FIRM|nr:histidinol-phosphate transaminase [Sporobacter termitidis]SHH77649.1 histidinol-phosphate aminotransferase [Sporobacter termitidis DSM 10068]